MRQNIGLKVIDEQGKRSVGRDDAYLPRSLGSTTNKKTRKNSSSPSEESAATITSSLTHLQYDWPGQTGSGQHLDVRPMSFDVLLSGDRIIVPIFQRRYCWTRLQIERWWRDVSKLNGRHGTGKTMFKKIVDYDSSTTTTTTKKASASLICIDGQQRLTTATLFLMALRAEARRHGKANSVVRRNSSMLVQSIDAVLFANAGAILGMKQWAKYKAFQLLRNSPTSNKARIYSFTMPSLPSGWLPPFATILTPSHIDRAAYFQLLCKDYILEALEEQIFKIGQSNKKGEIQLMFTSDCQESVQYTAFDIFATKLHRLTTSVAPQNLVSSTLNRLYKSQVVGFSIMYIELLTDDNVQQIFLWMQEKSVFGMGRLLFNESPGVDFTHVDLARNLILSSAMNEPLSAQLQFYKSFWIGPLENRFGTSGVRRILETLAKSILMGKGTRYIGDMEKQVKKYKEATPSHMQEAFSDDKPMMIYARFHSYVQKRAMEMENGNPNAISQKVAKSIVLEMVRIGSKKENVE